MRELGIVVILALVAVATATLVIVFHGGIVDSVTNERVSDEGLVYGDALQVGQGNARLYVQVADSGQPLAVGIEMSGNALVGLAPQSDQVFVLDMPPGFDTLPFKHATLDWNPHGHEPPGVYDLPHFDYHFYMIEDQERVQITFDDPGFDIAPDPAYLPADYAPVPGGVPRMGAHWIDTISPEFNGEPFSHTLIYGAYNGEVTFYEPMITMNFLLQARDYDLAFDIRQPSAFQAAGKLYPTRYLVQRNSQSNTIRVALGGLVMR